MINIAKITIITHNKKVNRKNDFTVISFIQRGV